MNRKHLIFTLSTILVMLLLSGCSFGGSDETGADDSATPIPPVIETSNLVSAEAFVVPIQEADIAFEANGRVIELTVKEGDWVTAGQLLARLDSTDTQAAVVVAEAALDQALANLEQTKVGPTMEQIASAQAAVKSAEARLAQTKTIATDAEIAQAEARVETLRAQLRQVQAGTREETVRASLAQLRQTEADVRLAQSDYDKIAYAADSDQAQPIALALEQATLRYEAAKASYEALANGATLPEVNVARAQIAEGEAALQILLQGPSEEAILVAEAGVTEAEAALAQAITGPTEEQIAVAEAGVQQAEASLEQARLALNKTELNAPFDGAITRLDIELGEYASPGSPIINIANTSVWRIETDDLTEIDVVKVSEGQPVEIRFDALDAESYQGVVTSIKPRSETKAGDVTYTVIIDLDNTDPRLRWGMTTFVEISTE